MFGCECVRARYASACICARERGGGVRGVGGGGGGGNTALTLQATRLPEKPARFFDLLARVSVVFVAVTGLLMNHAPLSEIL